MLIRWPLFPQSRRGRGRGIEAGLTRDISGVTAVEYALIAGIISLGVLAGAPQIGAVLSALFVAVSAAF